MSMQFDKIGEWSEIKLDIVSQYAEVYLKILRPQRFNIYYIDGFSGAGKLIRKHDGSDVAGSPVRVLKILKEFDRYWFIDLDGGKTEFLEKLCEKEFPDRNVTVLTGDCNQKLMEILPKYSWENRDRLLCLLDPYGLHLKWEVIEKMGKMKKKGIVDLILHFPIMDMNRNAIWHNFSQVSKDGIDRMNAFWGDDTWKKIAYKNAVQQDFLNPSSKEKQKNQTVADAFKRRLKEHGKFQYVPNPLPLKNSKGSTVYYLFFASQNETANKIATYLFEKHGRNK